MGDHQNRDAISASRELICFVVKTHASEVNILPTKDLQPARMNPWNTASPPLAKRKDKILKLYGSRTVL